MEYEFIVRIQKKEEKRDRSRVWLTVGIICLLVAIVAEFAINNYWSAVLIIPLLFLIAERTKMRGKTFTSETLARVVREGSEIRFDILKTGNVNNTPCDVCYRFEDSAINCVTYRADQNSLHVQARGQKISHVNSTILQTEGALGLELTVAPMDVARIENVMGRQVIYQ